MESLIEDLVGLVGKDMPDMKVVDEDYGQLEFIDREDRDTYPLVFPAVLIDAPDVSWSNIAGLSQKGVATVRVKLILDCYDDTHYTSGTVEKISEREMIRRRLHELLQGHRCGDGSALIRTSSRFYTFSHGIKVYESTYILEVSEYIEPGVMKAQRPTVVIATGIK